VKAAAVVLEEGSPATVRASSGGARDGEDDVLRRSSSPRSGSRDTSSPINRPLLILNLHVYIYIFSTLQLKSTCLTNCENGSLAFYKSRSNILDNEQIQPLVNPRFAIIGPTFSILARSSPSCTNFGFFDQVLFVYDPICLKQSN
jgi:hypothetical protein